MTWARSVLTVAMLAVAGGGVLAAQNPPVAAQNLPTKNPLEGNPDAIKYGQGLFRGRCADCHGMDARGVRGPDITQVWAAPAHSCAARRRGITDADRSHAARTASGAKNMNAAITTSLAAELLSALGAS